MQSMTNSIFLLNPLTVYFLAGFALELFVISCEQDHKESDKRISTATYDTNIRMTRWVGVFKNYCVELFKSYSEEYEITVLQNNINSPYQLHSKLLIGATQKMRQAVRDGLVTDKATFMKIQSWLKVITSIQGTSLRKIFEGENQESLNLLFEFLTETCAQGVINSANSNSNKYCHFSPDALFMRLSFIVFIHNKMFSDSTEYKMWELQNSNFMSKLLSISEYKQVANKSDIDHFHPSFPYIHHLPCRAFYQLWTGKDQINHPVPVYDIFYRIVQCIGGRMTTYQQVNESDSEDYESYCAFCHILTKTEALKIDENKKVSNCEKQRRQQSKRRKQDSEKTKSHSPQTWVFKFLFPPQYYSHIGIDWGNQTWDCAN